MKDFFDNELNIGDTIFFKHKPKVMILGKIGILEGKKTIIVHNKDIIKHSERYKTLGGDGVVTKCDEVIKIV